MISFNKKIYKKKINNYKNNNSVLIFKMDCINNKISNKIIVK